MNNFIKKPSGISEIAWNHMNNINVCKIINITKEDLIINKNNDIEGERNCYSIKFSQEQLKDITVNDIEALFKLIIYQRKILLKELNIEFMYFYIWHDILSGDLNFSLTSSNTLPFGCTLNIVHTIKKIINTYLSKPGGFIPIEELTEIKKEYDKADDEEFILDVYKYKLSHTKNPNENEKDNHEETNPEK